MASKQEFWDRGYKAGLAGEVCKAPKSGWQKEAYLDGYEKGCQNAQDAAAGDGFPGRFFRERRVVADEKRRCEARLGKFDRWMRAQRSKAGINALRVRRV